jgi:Asp-tRNA(Asn)/Glu-tRNA(Gln) amidotransferase A subunit family amidase
MAIGDEVCFMPATQMATAIRKRELSPLEVVDTLLARIERVNPALNAFTVVLADQAGSAAKRAEEAISNGEATGPLHGVPFTLKDLTFTKGVRTMRGSKAFAEWVPNENSIVVDRLLGAGGIFVGKTTTPEFGNKGITQSPLTGTTNNPWKTTHIAGGSSGGAAVAVAAGLGPLAEGSDAGGSIRIPASCCGVVGFKPSYGRVPTFPPSPFQTLAHQGPLARTVSDAAMMLTVMAGPDDRVPFAIAEREIDYAGALEGASVKGLRVAYSRDLGLAPVDPRVTARTDAAARLFAQVLGADVEEATPPSRPDPAEIMLAIWSATVGTTATELILPRVGRADVDPAVLNLLERAEKLSTIEYYRAAYLLRGEYYRNMMAFFDRYDLLLSPTLTTPPFLHPGWAPGPAEVAGKPINPLLGWVLTYPFNLTGQPAISLPCGFSDDGLPIGLQIVGRRHADIDVLRAAAVYEQAAPWVHLRPPLN